MEIKTAEVWRGSLRKFLSVSSHEDARRVIYEMFYDRVYRTAYYIVRDVHLAQDVLQESFIKAFRNLHNLEDGAQLEPWLMTIVRNTAIDFLRKKYKRNEMSFDNVILENSEHRDSVEDIVDRKLMIEDMRDTIKEMKSEYQEVLQLKYQRGLHDKEIAACLDVSLGTVKSRLFRARNKLRELFGTEENLREDGEIS